MYAAIQPSSSLDVRCRRCPQWWSTVWQPGRSLCHCKSSPQRPRCVVWGSQANARGAAQEWWSLSVQTQVDAKAHCLEGRHQVHTTAYAGRHSPSVCARCAWTPSGRIEAAPSGKHQATTDKLTPSAAQHAQPGNKSGPWFYLAVQGYLSSPMSQSLEQDIQNWICPKWYYSVWQLPPSGAMHQRWLFTHPLGCAIQLHQCQYWHWGSSGLDHRQVCGGQQRWSCGSPQPQQNGQCLCQHGMGFRLRWSNYLA